MGVLPTWRIARTATLSHCGRRIVTTPTPWSTTASSSSSRSTLSRQGLNMTWTRGRLAQVGTGQALGHLIGVWQNKKNLTMVWYSGLKSKHRFLCCLGFAIYRQGADLHAVVSTGTKVWNVTVVGMITDLEWINIGVRWKYSDVNSTTKANKDDVRNISISVLCQFPRVKMGGLLIS